MAALPANWREDEMVVGALFSPFRSREVNPLGYDSKMTFWRQELAALCRQSRRLRINWRKLEAEHIVGNHRPSCLKEVFANLRQTGEAVSVSELRSQCLAAQSWTAWGAEVLLWRPVRYAWGCARRWLWAQPEDEELVLVDSLKETADALYSRHVAHLAAARPAAGALILTDRLQELHRGLVETRADLELALLWLERDGRVVQTEVDGRPAVKFRLDGETGRPAVTELEKGVLRLTMVESATLEQVEQLEASQDRLRSATKTLLKNGQKEMAKKNYRQWKRSQAVLEKRLNSLSNVQGVLQSIEESKHNRKVLEALSRGTAAVRGAFGDVTVDKVEQVVADCQDMLEEKEDVDATLARPLSPVDPSEAAELEAELNELLSGGTPQAAAAQPTPTRAQLPDLPSPPDESPGKSFEQTPRLRLASRLVAE